MVEMARWMGCDIGGFPFAFLRLPIGENTRRVNAWNQSDIVKIGEEIDGLGVEFSSSCVGVVGDGRDIRFWIDHWVDNRRLCDRFPRLYYLERRKDLVWSLGGDGDFKVKDLSSVIEEKILHSDGGQETLWNKMVPKKVNIFVWRALRGRLCLITCDLAMSVWDKIYKWWKVWVVNAFCIDEFFSSNGNVNVPIVISRV
nr:zf-CCHC domain-containing protein/DUF4219 domain-containing protein/UBN2 domain-containing protein [Tanacetum cinerariifolium]